MKDRSLKSGGGQSGHQNNKGNNQGHSQSGNGQGSGHNQNQGGNHGKRPWGVGGKRKVRSQILTVPQPRHEHLSPFPGIEVFVRLVRGTNIGFSEVGDRNGLLFGELNTDPEREPVELFVKINDVSPALQGGRIIVFTRGKDAEIVVHASNHRRGRSTYRQTVRVSRSHGGRQVSVDQTTNNIYIAFITGAGVFVKALALVWQERFLLLGQQQYVVSSYRDGNGVVLPGFFEKHGGLPTLATLEEVTSFFDEIAPEQIADLEDVAAYRANTSDFDLSVLEDDECFVKLWTLRRGNGVGILRDGREVRLFWRDIVGTGPKALCTGQVVRFRSLERITDDQKRNQKTSFRWDARGLVLVS